MKRIRKHRDRLYKGLSIQQKILAWFSLFIVVVFIIQMVVYYLLFSRVVRSKANDYILETLKQTVRKIDIYMDSLRILSNSIASSETIQ